LNQPLLTAPDAVLASGARMPLIGFGTFPLRGQAAGDAVTAALATGYRSVDTAMRYRNEDAVGAAIAASPLPREDLFITTKLATDQVGYEREALAGSISALGVAYIDLWLIHWPPGGSSGISSWRRMLQAREDGLVRSLGVSNYSIGQIDGLIAATGVAPDVAQLSWSPIEFDPGYLEACRERGVQVSAHSPIRNTPLDHAVLTEIAGVHGRSVPQIILRWNLQHGVAAVPKSANPARMAENLDIAGFLLSGDEMAAINAISPNVSS
jgi:2,5-diketo-D-gluconate reductase A